MTLLRLAERERAQSREARLAFGQLTPREWDVLHTLAEGMGDKEIARKLGVRPGTRAATWRGCYRRSALTPGCRRSSTPPGTASSV